jgi:Protein of unknown function (DUF2933)
VTAGLAVVVLLAFEVPLGSLLSVGVLLLCPLMMARMHGGHGNAHVRADRSHEPDRAEPSDPGAPGTRPAGPSQEGGRT